MATYFKTLQSLLVQIRSLLKWMALAVLLGVLTVSCGIGLLALSAYLISEAALHPPLAALAVAILGVRVFGILRGIWRYLERLVVHDVTFRLLARLRVWFYQALMPLAPACLFARPDAAYTTGDLLSRFVADIETLQEIYARAVAPPVVALLVGLVMWFVLGAYNPLFALIFLCFFLLAGIGVPTFTYLLSQKLERRIVYARATLNAALVDSVQGMADLLAFDQAETQLARVWRTNRQLIHLQTGRAYVDGLRDMLDILLTDGCVWVMLLTAIPLVHSGQLNGVYLAFIALAALSSFEAVQPLASAAQRLGGCLEAVRRLKSVVDAPPATCDPARYAPMPSRYNLEVSNLSFRYLPESPPVLDKLSFSLPQGHCIALVGPSGAGKSTLIHLLTRFWDYEQGKITLGEQELHTLRQQDLLHRMGVVEQQTHLFNLTVRENLLLARPDASQGALEQATQRAMIHKFIQSLPQGYDTLIGEQGFKLSGGERQRLALARLFLQDAPLFILDEPTAHLDPLTEQALLHTLLSTKPDHTILLITHRLIMLEMADEIVFMDHGQVRERGTHRELMQARGLYWKHCLLQHQLLSQ
ncbi:MAG TPA: thiol reductant ABC exporter subunit CydC [Ktedonobacteraceae bacterium]|jgi:ATP-binding cassette subfamily C protein CydC